MSDYFDWDSVILNDNEFTLLDEGDYDFKVTKLDKGYAKSSGAPMATVTCEVTGDQGSTTCIVYLTLQKNCEWKLSQFFRSIGQKKHGEPLKMDWSKVVGSTGRCKVYIDTYTYEDKNENGETVKKERKNNKIERFYDPVTPQVDTPPQNNVPWN